MMNIRHDVLAVDRETEEPVVLSAFEAEATAQEFAELVKECYSTHYRDIRVDTQSAFLREDSVEEAFAQFVALEEDLFSKGGSDWEDDEWAYDLGSYPCGCCTCCGCDCAFEEGLEDLHDSYDMSGEGWDD